MIIAHEGDMALAIGAVCRPTAVTFVANHCVEPRNSADIYRCGEQKREETTPKDEVPIVQYRTNHCFSQRSCG